MPLVAEKFVSPAEAMKAFLGDATGVVAFGELHQTVKTAGVRSSIARFTDEILPAIAPRAAHLIVETWVSRGSLRRDREAGDQGCRPHDRAAGRDRERDRAAPAAGQGAGGRAARAGRRLPRVPVAGHDRRRRRLRPAADADRPASRPRDPAGAGPAAPADRPLVLVYGGALHNDLAPRAELAKYSFGPAIDALTHGDYREVDLFVPELSTPTRRCARSAGTPPGVPFAARPGTTLIRRQPRSAVLLFEDDGAHRQK